MVLLFERTISVKSDISSIASSSVLQIGAPDAFALVMTRQSETSYPSS